MMLQLFKIRGGDDLHNIGVMVISRGTSTAECHNLPGDLVVFYAYGSYLTYMNMRYVNFKYYYIIWNWRKDFQQFWAFAALLEPAPGTRIFMAALAPAATGSNWVKKWRLRQVPLRLCNTDIFTSNGYNSLSPLQICKSLSSTTS